MADTEAPLEFLVEFERGMLEAEERFRALLVDEINAGNPRAAGALAAWEARIAEEASGVAQARRVWRSISPAQRWALVVAHQGGATTARRGTLMALYKRGLLDGVRITERGRFVVLKGRG